MKKVEFAPKRQSSSPATSFQHWANQSGMEPTKRLTIDVPVSLHHRMKCQCAMEKLVMADVIRQLLTERFPPETGAGQGSVDTTNRNHDSATHHSPNSVPAFET